MNRPAIRVRGRSFIALALAPEMPLMTWLHELDQQVARAPGYFAGKPVVLDLTSVQLHGPGLRSLLAELRQRSINVLGLEGIDQASLGDQAEYLPPILSGGRPGGAVETIDDAATRGEEGTPEVPAEPESTTLMVNEPLRSGQSIHFMKGDVVVIGSVASGAEIIASGSIHVYGALRGRALAGISGNAEAKIFCNKLDAELLAITGAYVTAESIGPELRGKQIQAWFDGTGISIKTLE